MRKKVLKVHPDDNVIVALENLSKGEEIDFEGKVIGLTSDIPIKHKFAEKDFSKGQELYM